MSWGSQADGAALGCWVLPWEVAVHSPVVPGRTDPSAWKDGRVAKASDTGAGLGPEELEEQPWGSAQPCGLGALWGLGAGCHAQGAPGCVTGAPPKSDTEGQKVTMKRPLRAAGKTVA